MPFRFAREKAGGFELALTEADGRWDVTCAGSLDAVEASAIVQPELLRLHAAVLDAKIPVVGLHLENVDYMNSSGLKSFMSWFLAASNARPQRYVIEVTYDPGRSWQVLSLRPMERLAPDTVRLVERAGSGSATPV